MKFSAALLCIVRQRKCYRDFNFYSRLQHTTIHLIQIILLMLMATEANMAILFLLLGKFHFLSKSSEWTQTKCESIQMLAKKKN